MSTQPFEYAVLRYVHDPVANECLNIGIVVFSRSGKGIFFDSRFEQRYGRLSEAFSGFNGENFRRFVNRIQRHVEHSCSKLNESALFQPGTASLGEMLSEMVPDSGLSFRFGEVCSGITDDPAAELGHLFYRFVTSQCEREQGENRNDEAVWNTFKAPLKAHRVLDKLVEKTFTADDFDYTFPHAFKNGKWHVLESASFDYVRADQVKQKATNYLGIGSALSRNSEIGKMYLLLGKPTRESHLVQYERAKRLLSEHLQIEHVLIEEQDADELAATVAEFMDGHPSE
jgi:hypothetical protein